MKVLFLGAGEAFGEKTNVSMLINDEILLECGPHTLLQLMKRKIDIRKIKLIYLSHLHADHAFGLPAFILASQEEGRRNDLLIMGPKGLENYTKDILNISYKKKMEDISFRIILKEIDSKSSFEKFGYIFSFKETYHSIPCYSISIEKEKKLTYTGDGKPTKETFAIAKNSDILISEAYGEEFEKHSSAIKAAKLAKNSNVKLLVLVHIYRKSLEEEIEKAANIFSPILIPNEFDTTWI